MSPDSQDHDDDQLGRDATLNALLPVGHPQALPTNALLFFLTSFRRRRRKNRGRRRPDQDERRTDR